MKPTGAYWKTSRNAKASHFGRGVCGADGEGKDAAQEPDTQRYAPCLSEPSYRNAAGVISPGLPSQALTRQLPQSGSPLGDEARRSPQTLLRASGDSVGCPCGMPKPLTLKDSPGRGRRARKAPEGGGKASAGADGEGKDAAKEPDTQRERTPACQSHRIATPLE